jgi:hypothetical protein
LYENLIVAAWNQTTISAFAYREPRKPVWRLPVTGCSGYTLTSRQQPGNQYSASTYLRELGVISTLEFQFLSHRKQKVNEESYPCKRPWRLIVVRTRGCHILDNRLTDGGKVVSATRRPRFTSQEDSWYSFLLEAETTPELQGG